MSKKKKELPKLPDGLSYQDFDNPPSCLIYGEPLPTFTGIARSVEAYNNHGFRNFRILTLHIVDGKVIKIERSDPYANFETISRMELANELAIHYLNNNWKNGKTLEK